LITFLDGVTSPIHLLMLRIKYFKLETRYF